MTLSDVAFILQERWIVVVLVMALTVAGGGASAFTATPQYEASTNIIPLHHPDVIQEWFESRSAAMIVVNDVGEPLHNALHGEGAAGVADAAATAGALRERVSVTVTEGLTPRDRVVLTITVLLPEPALAVRVVDAYVDTLHVLRPELESLTAAELYQRMYDGTNHEEAHAYAEHGAQQGRYWVLFDAPAMPTTPASPNVPLILVVSGVLGVILGVVTALTHAWFQGYREYVATVRAQRVAVAQQSRAGELPASRLSGNMRSSRLDYGGVPRHVVTTLDHE